MVVGVARGRGVEGFFGLCQMYGGLGLRAGETTLVHTVYCFSSCCSRDWVLQALL